MPARTYGSDVGTTGLIYAAIAVAWLAYLIPNYLRRREETSTDSEAEDVDVSDRFSGSVRVIRSGSAPLLDHDLATTDDCQVSTPLTRRAAVTELRRLEQLAASRRRRVLLGVLIALTGVVAVVAAGLLPWWTVAIPGGAVLGFFGVSRFGVAVMRRRLDERYAEISLDNDEEQTVALSREQLDEVVGGRSESASASRRTEKQATSGVLWDPLPITMPTYVSKPLAPRTVRTIDLSAPDLTTVSDGEVPVTADARPVAEPVPTPDQVVEVAKPEVAKPGAAKSRSVTALTSQSDSSQPEDGHRPAVGE